jgi:membrane protein
VFGPLIWRGAVDSVPELDRFSPWIAFLRLGVATVLIVAALVLAHKFIPAGRRSFRAVIPGVAMTLFLWIVGGLGFGWYLEYFPGAYASTYGSLSTALIALVFLYTLASIFLFGGELNGTLIAAKRRQLVPGRVPSGFDDFVRVP